MCTSAQHDRGVADDLIPVVDMASYSLDTTGGSREHDAEVERELLSACEHVGFVFVSGLIDPPLIDACLDGE